MSLREGEDALFLEVADRGKGVAPGAGEQVFQRLVTLEDSRSSGEGSGLGLSIARELARRMGGDIDLESVPGLRTVFTVRLPNGKTKEIRKNCANLLKVLGLQWEGERRQKTHAVYSANGPPDKIIGEKELVRDVDSM
mgnify:CR=1 FL=1